MGSFKIHVAKEYLGFSSAHFITYDGHQCETLHGHNYRASITIAGPVDENFYVVDFSKVKKMMKRLCDEIDHKLLLAADNQLITIEEHEDGVAVSYKHRRFFFPNEDVILLPIPNTTAEMLAQYLCGRAKGELREMGATHIGAIDVEVEEAPGQSATYGESL
jgi:6-pyruvoyltetrahydropterin/6-carboxytetrahydropterin synthase